MRLRYLHRQHRRRESRYRRHPVPDLREVNPSDPSRIHRSCTRPPPAHPFCFHLQVSPIPPASKCRTVSSMDFSSSIQLLPASWLTEHTNHGQSGPFAPPPPRSAGVSPLLRTGPPAHSASVLNPLRGLTFGRIIWRVPLMASGVRVERREPDLLPSVRNVGKARTILAATVPRTGPWREECPK